MINFTLIWIILSVVGLFFFIRRTFRTQNSFQNQQLKQFIIIFLILGLFAIGEFTAVNAFMGPTLPITKDFGGSTALEVESGEEFTYFIAYRCASILSDCTNTTLTDPLPPEVVYVDSSAPASDIQNISYDSGDHEVTVDFVDPLGAGTTGIIEITVKFPPGTLPGTTAVNQATSTTDGGIENSNNATATATGFYEMFVDKQVANDNDDGVIGSDFLTNYSLNVCNPDDRGGVQLLNPTIVDQLPPKATFVSASHSGVYNPVFHTITWTSVNSGGTLVDPVPVVDGCSISLDVTVRFNPNGPDGIPANSDDPQISDIQTNTMTLTGSPEDGSPDISLPDSVDVTLQGPYYGDTISKSAGSPSSYIARPVEELPGGVVNYTIQYENTGTITATLVTITDSLPSEAVVTSIQVDTIQDPTNAFYRSVNNPIVWTPFPNNSYGALTTVPVTTTATANPNDIELAPGDRITEVRWDIGVVPFNSGTWTAVISTIVDPGTSVAVTYDNDVSYSADYNDGTPQTSTGDDDIGVTTIDPRAIPRISKTTSQDSLLPGEVTLYTIEAYNADVAHNNIIAPITIGDLLPERLEVVIVDNSEPSGYRVPNASEITSGAWYSATSTNGAPAPTHVFTPTFNAQNETLMRWEFDAPYEMPPGERITISFYARVLEYTVPQQLDNNGILLWEPTTVNVLACDASDGNNSYIDTDDIDGDGNTAETGCQIQTPMQVEAFLAMDSQKFVQGNEQTGWKDYDYTVTGGDVDYRMVITNTSNVTATNIIIYDIFPHVGDTGTIDLSSRDSEWAPHLFAPITDTQGLPMTISYSQSTNPCRPEVLPSGPAGCVNDWSTTPPADITSVKALRFDMCNGTCLELPPDNGSGGGSFEFSWDMVAPNSAQVGDIAWNSFGFFAEGGGLTLLPSEPIRVGIEVVTNTLPGYSIGDYVWLDVAGDQDDGIQQSEETGISGVRVELWDADTNTFLDYRTTGPDASGDPGYYEFINIPNGNYFIRFFQPQDGLTYTFSPGNQGGNDAIDSDGTTPGNDATHGDYYQTDDFVVNNADDYTIDQGMWLPTDYGDAPNSYPVESASLGANPELAGRHIIVDGIYMGSSVDAELDGQPDGDALGDDATDDEDGVTFDQYIGSVAAPSALMNIGEDSTVTISPVISSPHTTTTTAYLQAWIDFNGDGDWDDPDEQIATDVLVSNGVAEPIVVSVPSGATAGTTYARFRLSTEQGLAPSGTARDGEVEDYKVQLLTRPEKSIVATSEAHTENAQLAIGEIVRYHLRVSVPEGDATNFSITDNLPSRLQFMDDGTATIGYTATTTVTWTQFVITGGPFGSGDNPVFNLGTVTNNDTDSGEEFIYIEFNALALNDADSTAGNRRRNTFTVNYDTYSDTSNQADIRIVEPDIDLTKTLTTTPNDAGDTAVYELTATNSTGTYIESGFDLSITDTLDAALDLQAISINAPGYALITDTSNIGANQLNIVVDRLDPSDTVTVVLTATLASTAPAGETITNTGYLLYSSLPLTGTIGNPTGSNTPGGTGDDDGERDGSNPSGKNDHADTDSVPFSIDDPTIDKQVTPTTYTIGENVTYDVIVTLPEGLIADLEIVDDLPTGLGYISHQIIETAAASGGLLTNDYNGTLPVPSVTALGGSGVDVTLDFGDTTTNDDNDANNNSFLLRITAVVINELGNQDGDTLTNTATLSYTVNGSTTSIDDSVDIDLVEPILDITKQLQAPIPTPLDAGTVITYQIVLEHALTTASDAFDVVITDTLPATLINPSVVSVTASGISAPTHDLAGNVVRVPDTGSFDFPQGSVVTVTVQAEIGGSAFPGQSIENTAGATWSTLDGTPSEERDGGGDPDGNDPLDGGALDDYEVDSSESFNVDGTATIKSLVDTSAGHTAGSNVTIGEIITYTIGVTVPEATIPNLVITDALPVGLAYVAGSLTVDDSSFSGTLPAPTITATGGDGDDITIEYGAFSVPGDNNPANNSFTVTYAVVVLDVAGNVGVNPPGQTILSNDATVQIGSSIENVTPVDVTVVEPQMVIEKSFNTDEASPNDTITVTLTVTNTGTSGAFEVIIDDPIDNSEFNNITEGTTAPGFTFSTVPSGGNTIVRYTGGDISVGGSVTFTFEATLLSNLLPSPPNIDNVATVTQATTLDDDTYDGDDSEERDEPDVDDNDELTVVIPDLVLTKNDGLTYVGAGDQITYTLSITNVGSVTATGVVITETVPTFATFAGTPAGWSCVPDNSAGSTCTYAVGSLADGASTSVDYSIIIDDPLPSLTPAITNTAVTGDDGTKGIDPTPANNSDDDSDVVLATIGDYVWDDLDADGVQDGGESGVSGVTVVLYDVTNTPVQTMTTNASGYYSFTRLIPNQYSIRVIPPAGYEISPQDNGGNDATDSDIDPTTGQTIPTLLDPGEIDLTWDAGIYIPASLGDFIWYDADNDGVQDGGLEEGLIGVTVDLYDGVGTFITTTTTDASGYYSFTNLVPGNYYIDVTPPPGYTISPKDTPGSDATDSDIDPVTGETDITNLISGENDPTWDGGLYAPPVSLGSFVWLDANGDGLQDLSEDGIAGATIELLVDNGSGTFIPATTVTRTTVSDITTLADGQYFFNYLMPGDYRVRVTPPAGLEATVIQNSTDNDDTENDSNIATNLGGGVYESATFTLSDDGEPSETDTFDGDNQDNTFDENNGNMTVDFGFVEPVSIGSFVWLDNNFDGIQDSLEPGISGAVVELLVDKGSGSFIPATTVTGTAVISQTTGADGLYFFDNLPPGDYRVQVTPPAGHLPTDNQVTTDNDDSFNDTNIALTPSAGTYQSGVFTLNSNSEPTETGSFEGDNQDNANENDGNMSVDFGFVQPVSMGSFVWHDVDGDGLQGGSEPGIAGATIELLVDSGGGTFVPATTITGTAVISQTTLADGLYYFDELPPGDYRVRVTPPANYLPSIPQTTADNDDTENDSNVSIEPVAGTFESATFTLDINGEPIEAGSFDGDNQDASNNTDGNMTVDFGFITPVSIGSYIWLDENGDGDQDALEPAIPGAIVELLVDNGSGSFIPATTITGTAVLSQTTLADGLYFFDNLPPNNYRVRVTPPNSFKPTFIQTTANNDNNPDDSNIASEPVAGTYESATFTLVSNDEPNEGGGFAGDNQDDGANETDGNMTVDFGFVEPVSIGSYVWLDADGNGQQDALEVGISGADVTLLIDDGTGSFVPAVDVDGSPVLTQTTAADGLYFFDNLPPGEYRIRVTPPAGFDPTTAQTAAGNDDTENDSNIASEPVAGTFESGTFSVTIDGEPTETDTFDGDTRDNATDNNNGNMTIDFGFVGVVSVGSYVWLDADYDGVQDATETGIPGAVVELLFDSGGGTFIPAKTITGTAVLSQTTGADGLYHFDDLPPGNYRVRVTPPASYLPTDNQTTADDDDTEDDSNIATEPVAGTYESGTFTLTSGGEPDETETYDGDNQDDGDEANGNMTVDFGFVEPVSLGSYVWFDVDGDGLQGATESGIAGAVVELLVDSGGGTFVPATTITGTAVLSQTTLADGLYFFENLPPGDYRVQVTPPANYVPSAVQTTADDDDTEDDSNIATEPVAGTYQSGTFTLLSNGEPDETETYDGDNQDDGDESNGNMTIDFAFVEPVSLGSYIWADTNNDGIQDPIEDGIANATVELLVDSGGGVFIPATDLDETAVLSQTTAADGQYFFENLPPGDYRVRVTPPSGFAPSATQTTADDDNTENDSNIASEPSTGTYESGTFPLASDGEPDETETFDGDNQDDANETDGNMTVDFGFVPVQSIGSVVWEDNNSNSLQDGGEPGISGAVVELLVDSGGGVFVPATTITGTAVLNQTTLADGLYHFENLPPGDYQVQVTPPAGYEPSPLQTAADNDDTENDSNISTEPISGTYRSGTFTLSLNGEPSETGTYLGDNQDNATDNNNGNMTVDFGFISSVSIGSFVWFDQDGDGLQGATESAITGAVVELLVDSGGGVFVPATTITGTAVLSQTTGADGLYHFENLPPGDYRVRVTPPADFTPSNVQNGSDNDNTENDSNIASEPVAGTYESGTFTLTTNGGPTETDVYDGDNQDNSSETDGNMTVDFGFIQPVSIGSFIWFDVDGDGEQDALETGIDGAVVELLVDNGSGTFIPATSITGTAVLSQTTGADGQYVFDNLPPGDYRVQVTPPANYSASPVQTTADDDDTENDSNIASEPVAGTYQSGTFMLVAENEPPETGTFDGDGQDDGDESSGNMTVDFGFVEPVSIGSYVWVDNNDDGLQDATENGLPGAIVELIVDDGLGTFIPAVDVGGTAVLSQTTGADGLYFFDNLPPGEYRVRVTPPAGVVPSSTQTATDNDDTENDTNIASEPVAGTFESGSFTLINGIEPTESGVFDGDDQDNGSESNGNMTIDFGFLPVQSIGSFVWEDLDGSGTQDVGEPGITGATVELLVDSGGGMFVPATTITGTAVLSQITGADGLYHFENLPPGEYRVRVTPPAGVVPTYNQNGTDNDDTAIDSNIASEPIANTFESGTFTLDYNTEPIESGSFNGDSQDVATSDGNGNMTIDFGFFQPVAVGNFVWIDDGVGGGTPLNGIVDGTEVGVPGVILELYRDGETPGVDTPLVTTTTSISGTYVFDMIPQGDYIIHIPASEFQYGEPLSSFVSSTGNGGDDNLDDDVNENGIDNPAPYDNGISSDTISLTVGSEPPSETGQGNYTGSLADSDANMTVDFGFYELLTLGNVIWFDDDRDGEIDGGESGVPAGVIVNLLDENNDPILHPISGLPITTTTDADGNYEFTHLTPGEYVVQIDPVNFQTGGSLEGYISSDGSADPDDVTSDIDDNGIDGTDPTVDGIRTPPVTLDYDAEPDNFDDTDDNDNTNLTIDLGVVLDPTAVTLTSFTATHLGNGAVHIQWATAEEIDNFGFRIYRSNVNDFGTATEVHFEPTAVSGGTGPGNTYSYQDAVTGLGAFYYWLVDVETDGDTAVNGPISVQIQPGVKVYLPLVIGTD